MRNIIRVIAVVGALMLVAGLGVTAFANSNSPSSAPVGVTTSPSDDASPGSTESPSDHHGHVGSDDDGTVEHQNEGPSENDDDGTVEDQNEGPSGNDDDGTVEDQNDDSQSGSDDEGDSQENG